METKQPQLIFACELSAKELARLFLDNDIIPVLQGLGARVSLGILDFSEQRVEIT